MEFHFEHTVRTMTPPEEFPVMVTANIEREDGPVKVGFDIPVGISGEALGRLALDYYTIMGIAWEKWREELRPEIVEQRRTQGPAGDREAG